MASKNNTGKKVVLGAGLALAAAAAAGAYFLYGTKEGAKQRKKIAGWSLKMKGEVLEKLENLKEWNQEAYNKAVDAVGNKYRQMKSIDSAEVEKAMKEMKSQWKHIMKDAEMRARRKK
ncbi:MAG TPA: hypothetical protein VGA53_02440 [Candidatus Paceibacterota bacterium]